MDLTPRFLLLPLLALAGRASGQALSIGTPTANSSAMLDVSSTSRGLLPPRLTQVQLNAVAAPATGLLAYNSTTNQLMLWNGAGWQSLLSLGPASTGTPQAFSTPGASTYTVPANTYALDVTLRGGSGGLSAKPALSYYSSVGNPGTGGTASARVYVTPGQGLEVRVGGKGTNGGLTTPIGGYNGGGSSGSGGAGGGATDLRYLGSGLGGRILVAGGGGGAPSANGDYTGGPGGYPSGGNGGDQFASSSGSFSGKGGTQTAGGAGGQPISVAGGGTYGAGGNSGALGVGADGPSYGGGGGGGYYGGGSGGTMTPYNGITFAGGGGGGGSSYAGGGTAQASFQSNGQTLVPSDGAATITPVVPVAAPALDATNFTNLPTTWRRAGSSLSQAWLGERVGIGTNAPAVPLEVVGNASFKRSSLEIQNDNANAFLILQDPGDADLSVGMDRSSNNNFKISNGQDPSNAGNYNYLTIRRDNACIGIGTMYPAAPLHIANKVPIGQYNYAYYAAYYGGFILETWSAGSGYSSGATPANVSVMAEGRVVAPEFNSLSDQRLKTVRGRSDQATDLALLRRLRVTDYQMRDRARYGDRLFKKVLAQEVEQVFPQAVSQHPGFVPDVYATACCAEALPGDSLLCLTLPAAPAEPLRPGQQLRLAGPAGETTATVVQAAGPELTLRGVARLAGQPVFVFGRAQTDVRTVDYEALSMLNVSATQALADHLQTLQATGSQVQRLSADAGQAARQARQAAATANAASAHIQQVEQQLAAAEARLRQP